MFKRYHSLKLDFCYSSRLHHSHCFKKKHINLWFEISSGARRKKKKPTTFVPPPNLNMEASLSNGLENAANTGLMSIPFWRRPVARSHTYGS